MMKEGSPERCERQKRKAWPTSSQCGVPSRECAIYDIHSPPVHIHILQVGRSIVIPEKEKKLGMFAKATNELDSNCGPIWF